MAITTERVQVPVTVAGRMSGYLTRPKEGTPRRATRFVLAILSFGVATAASATTVPPYLTVGVDIGGGSAHDIIGQNLPFASQTNNASGSTPNGSTKTAVGNASADAFGTLKVDASAGVSASIADFPGVGVNISSVAERADEFHVLPPSGASWSFLATLEWSGTSSGSCGSTSSAFCVVNVTNKLLSDSSFPQSIDNSFYYDSSDPAHNVPPAGTHTVQKIWTFTGPSSFGLTEELILGVSVSAFGAVASFAGDLGHTGHFYLDPITPGAIYTTDSGNLYLAPVPEPASWTLLAAGALAVASLAHVRGRLGRPGPRREVCGAAG